MITAVRPRLGIKTASDAATETVETRARAGSRVTELLARSLALSRAVYFLAWRDIVVRYKQTAIGVAWALIRPALTMLVFMCVSAGWPDRQSGRLPEPMLVFAAVLPWQFFSAALTESSASLIGNANLISKVYFPRLIIPGGAVVTALVDFADHARPARGADARGTASRPAGSCWRCPLFVVLAVALVARRRPWLAALNVQYRDFRYVVPVHRPVRSVRVAGRVHHCAAFPSDGALSTRSTRWSASSTASAGRFWAAARRSIAPGVVLAAIVDRGCRGPRRLVFPPHGTQLRRRDLIAHERSDHRSREPGQALPLRHGRAASSTSRCATCWRRSSRPRPAG